MNCKKFCFLGILLLASVAGVHAQAVATANWTLQDAVFSDGGTASGYFTEQFGTSGFIGISYDLTVSGGDTALFPAFTFQLDFPGTNQNGQWWGVNLYGDSGWEDTILEFFAVNNSPQSPQLLQLGVIPWGSTLPSYAPNIWPLLTDNPAVGETYNNPAPVPVREFVSGELVSTYTTYASIPEGGSPWLYLLLCTGLVGFVGAIRRKLA